MKLNQVFYHLFSTAIFSIAVGFNTEQAVFSQEIGQQVNSSSSSFSEANQDLENYLRFPHKTEKQPLEGQVHPNQRQILSPPDNVVFQTYRLAHGDSIFVHVSPRSEQLSGERVVDLEGNINLPLIGIIRVEGLNLEEATQLVTQNFREYLVKPVIKVTLVRQRTARISIIGEVVRPGFYRLDPPELIAALREAGGVTRRANLREIQVARYQPSKNAVIQKFNVYSVLESGSEASFPRLVDGDVVIVSALDKTASPADSYNPSLIANSNISQPEITLRVLNYTGTITRLKLSNGSDFLDAVSAIGPDPSKANLKQVTLVRFDPISKKVVSTRLNARAALEGNITQNPILEHNDVIVIGRTTLAKLTYALGEISKPFKDVLGFLLFFDSFGEGLSKTFGSD